MGESWIGSVRWKIKNEEVPLDYNKREMGALATIFIKNKEHSPNVIAEIDLITIFISDSFYEGQIDLDNLEKYFVIRTYSTTTTLVECKWSN